MDESKLLEDFKNIVIDEYFINRDKNSYFNDFKSVLKLFKENISIQKYNDILQKINAIYTEKPENRIYKYYQFIVELVVGKHLLLNFGDTFDSEVKLVDGKKTDVDFQIVFKGITYNIEVKCPNFKVKDAYNRDTENLKVSFLSRGRTKDEYINYLEEIKNDIINQMLQKGNYKRDKYAKLEDDKIKDFLISGQSKFPDCNDSKHLNILIIGLDSPMDIVEWYTYFTNKLAGFFNYNSYIKHEDFEKVDMVIISNVVSGHRDLKKIDNFSCWEIGNYFNYFLVNPFSLNKKILNKKNMYKVYQELKKDGTLSGLNQSNKFIMILSKIYNDFQNMKGITEEEMISYTIDCIYNTPILYTFIVENIYYFKFAKKINDSNLSEVYSYVNDIIPNKTLEFDSFRDEVVELYKGKNVPSEFISVIYDHLFNNYICDKYDILVDKTEQHHE